MTEKFDCSEVGDLASSPFVLPPQSAGYDKTRIKFDIYLNMSCHAMTKKVLSVSSHLLDGKAIDPKPATPKNR